MTTTLVVGVGYLGKRFLEQNDARGVTRADFDLDRDDALDVELPQQYSVIYTVPPSRDSASDTRLERLLCPAVECVCQLAVFVLGNGS